MTSEQKWRCVWGGWVLAFAVAETFAIQSGNPKAPLSHHARKALRAGESSAGAIVVGGASAWLISHLWNGSNG